jgi:hypothetical protein
MYDRKAAVNLKHADFRMHINMNVVFHRVSSGVKFRSKKSLLYHIASNLVENLMNMYFRNV